MNPNGKRSLVVLNADAAPLDRDDHGRWYVRQKDFAGETWDLFCLDPASAPDPIDVSLRDEIAFAERLEAGFERWREGR
jgi:hypothetical protein